MKNNSRFTQSTRLLLVICMVLGGLAIIGANGTIPVTSTRSLSLPAENEISLPDIQEFIETVTNGQSDVPAGVYVPGLLALKIVQQPKDNPAFVSTMPDLLTQFRMASGYLTVGLLAHNFLAGSQFFKLQMDQEIILVFGDGSLKHFKVSAIRSYQALSPNNPYSNFIPPESDKTLTSEEVFKQIYAKGNQLVFQTCIQKGSEDSWGRLFVIADEAASLPAGSFAPSDYLSATHFTRAVVGTD